MWPDPQPRVALGFRLCWWGRPGWWCAVWLMGCTAANAEVPAGGAAAVGRALNPAQLAWLQQVGPVRLAPEQDYGPFTFSGGDGRLQGLSVDMLRRVQAHTGLAVSELPAAPLAQQLALARARQADLVTSLRPTPERSEYLLFTQPYVRVPAVLVRRDAPPAASGRVSPVGHPLSAFAGRPVAVGAGYAVEPVVRLAHPQVAWQGVSDDVVALKGVLEGRFAAAVVDAASAAFVQQQHGLRGLETVGEVGFDYELSFAVRSDWPQLRDVLNAGISAMAPAERRALLERWLAPLDVSPPAARAPWSTRLALGLLLAALLGTGVLFWQRTRQHPV